MEATHHKIRELERQKDAEDRLVANRSALGNNPTTVKEGLDDRWNILHPGCFLPGSQENHRPIRNSSTRKF
jgi:hypothetical protein